MTEPEASCALESYFVFCYPPTATKFLAASAILSSTVIFPKPGFWTILVIDNFSKAFDSAQLTTFFHKLTFAGLPPFFDGLDFFFFTYALAYFFTITKATSVVSAEVHCFSPCTVFSFYQ